MQYLKATIFLLLGFLFAQIFVHGGAYLMTLPTHNRPIPLVVCYITSFFLAAWFFSEIVRLLGMAFTAKPCTISIADYIMVYSDRRKDHCVDHGEVLLIQGDFITYRSFRCIKGSSRIAHKSIVRRMGAKHATT